MDVKVFGCGCKAQCKFLDATLVTCEIKSVDLNQGNAVKVIMWTKEIENPNGKVKAFSLVFS